jgi:hypothetical protein
MHEVEALHLRGQGARQLNRARVVDEHVDAAERAHGRLHGREHLLLLANVRDARNGAAPRLLDFPHGVVHRAGELRVRGVRLTDDGDAGAVAGRAEGDRLADAARRAGDEENLAGEGHGGQDSPDFPMRARVSSLAPDAVLAGRFRIRRALGQGSMGSVFEAEDGRDGRIVALKVSAPDDAADARARRRLAREVDAGRTIDSPHVVRALAAGEDSATGLVWIALDLAPGPSLDAYVREHAPLEVAVAGRLLLQLGDALAAAHRVGVVHRDLKPDNIRVEERPEGPWLRVLDFGIAKSVAALEVSATAPGLGTPLWVAPEQSRAGNAPAPSADVWAYGLVAFFVLTGKLYWWHAREASSLAELALEIVRGTLEPASVRAQALGVARPLPVGFDAWFARTVTREPGARFADADAARRALAGVLDARPIDRGGPVIERPWRLLLALLAGCAAMGYAISRIIRG